MSGIPLQHVVMSVSDRVPSISEERHLLLTVEEQKSRDRSRERGVDCWVERLDPWMPVYQLKMAIQTRKRWRVEEFRLVTRERELDEKRSLHDNGVDGESIVYVLWRKN